MTTSPTATTTLTEDDVRDLVRDWFRALDRHVSVERITPHLVCEGLAMVLPETTLRNHEDFREWYDTVTRIFFDEIHELTSMEVRRISDTEAEVSLVANWQTKVWNPPEPDSVWKGFDAYQTWTVVLQDGKPRIRSYIVDRLVAMPGSPAL
jgi:hypothetical protein